MRVIGLTGGTGSGKSTVSAYLKKRGCCIIDADEIARQLTSPGGEALDPIREKFGDSVFYDDGTLDRKKLGNIVFKDEEKLKILEEITTKIVIRKITDKIHQMKESGYEGIVILDAPLLFEFGMEGLADENWLVICDRERRIKRLENRDGLSRHEITDRMANHLSDEKKMDMADQSIDNSGSIDDLYNKIDQRIERIKNENN